MELRGLGVFLIKSVFIFYVSAVFYILLVAAICSSSTRYPASCDPLHAPSGTPLYNKYLMNRQPSGGSYATNLTDAHDQYVYYKFSQGCNMIVDSASIAMRGNCTFTTSVSFDLASGVTTGRKLSTVTRSSCDDICNQTLIVGQGKLNLARRGYNPDVMITTTIVWLSVRASSNLKECRVGTRIPPKRDFHHLDFRLLLRDIDECNTSSDVCTTTGTNCENTLGSFHCVRNTSSTITLPVTEQQTVQKTSVTPVSQLTSSLQGQTAVTSLPSSPEYNKRPPTRSASTTSNVPLTAGTAIITVGSTSLEMTEASISHLSTAVKPHISISLYPNFSRYLSATETATSTNEEEATILDFTAQDTGDRESTAGLKAGIISLSVALILIIAVVLVFWINRRTNFLLKPVNSGLNHDTRIPSVKSPSSRPVASPGREHSASVAHSPSENLTHVSAGDAQLKVTTNSSTDVGHANQANSGDVTAQRTDWSVSHIFHEVTDFSMLRPLPYHVAVLMTNNEAYESCSQQSLHDYVDIS